jgi:NADPH2:quinone reductase
MRAVVQRSSGSANTLEIGEVDAPTVGAGQLLVRVQAAGINRADIVQREGRYPAPPGASTILGLEVAGEVVAVGAGVDDFHPGDAVFGLVAGGGYAELALLDAACAISKPDWLTFEAAAALPEAWMTAWFNLVTLGGLKAGETALIHAGASGVGAAAIQLATLLRAKAVVTVGSPDKARFCRQLGADVAVEYKHEDYVAAVNAMGGADVVLDPIGGDYMARDIQCTRPDGRIIVIGLMGGAHAQMDLGRLLVKRLTVRGSTLRPQPLAVKAMLTDAVRDTILPALATGAVQQTLDRVFDWTNVRAAHQYLESNANLGKVILSLNREGKS